MSEFESLIESPKTQRLISLGLFSVSLTLCFLELGHPNGALIPPSHWGIFQILTWPCEQPAAMSFPSGEIAMLLTKLPRFPYRFWLLW